MLLFAYLDHHGWQPTPDWGEALIDAWVSMPSPSITLSADHWEELFAGAGWLDDGGEPRPTRIPTLYRGAVEGWEHGMSWTDDLEVARGFYERNIDRFGEQHRVVLVARKRTRRGAVLARIWHVRSEAEWIVQPPLPHENVLTVVDEHLPHGGEPQRRGLSR